MHARHHARPTHPVGTSPISPPLHPLLAPQDDFGWPSMYAVNAVGLPFFALRYLWGAVGTGTPLSAHYQLVTAASYTAAFLWAGVVCGARLYSGVSSPADVQGGMLVGGVLVRLWLPVCDRANAWIIDPEATLLGLPPWLALACIAALMVLLHPFTPGDPRSWTAIAYSTKAIAFGYSFILGSNACVRLQCAAAAPPPLASAAGLLLLLLRNLLGFCCLGVAWATPAPVNNHTHGAAERPPWPQPWPPLLAARAAASRCRDSLARWPAHPPTGALPLRTVH